MTDERPQPVLRGERVRLRPMESRDLDAYRSGVNDRTVGDPAGYKVPLSADAAALWLQTRRERMERGEGFYFVICPLDGDEFIGTTWLHHLDRVNGNGELAIFVDADHLGAGWGTDAAAAVIDFGFGELRLERIHLSAYADNARAIRSYQKLGFVLEARLRHAAWHHGAFVDAVVMSLLRHEWIGQPRPKAWEHGAPPVPP